MSFPPDPNAYEILEEIGHGASAKVMRAVCKANGKEVAVKVMDLVNGAPDLEEIRKEIQAMSMCRHANLVSNECSFVYADKLWIIMPYLGGGSVLDIMKFAWPRGFDEHVIATILKGVLSGIEYLHNNGQMHRDIKCSNILLGLDGSVRLADFGVSAWLVGDGQRRVNRNTFVGTPCWMAPEVMDQKRSYDYRADIWSFGITAVEMALGRAPLADLPAMEVLVHIMQKPPPTLDRFDPDRSRFSKAFHELAALCLQKDPSRRPTAAKLLEHKFFRGAKRADFLVSKLLKSLPPLAERAAQLDGLTGAKGQALPRPRQTPTDLTESALIAAAAERPHVPGLTSDWIGPVFDALRRNEQSIGKGPPASSSSKKSHRSRPVPVEAQPRSAAANVVSPSTSPPNVSGSPARTSRTFVVRDAGPVPDGASVSLGVDVQRQRSTTAAAAAAAATVTTSSTQLLQQLYQQSVANAQLLQSLESTLRPSAASSSPSPSSDPLRTVDSLRLQVAQLVSELENAHHQVQALQEENARLRALTQK
jgi:serine/threonine-protein kinase OSR1/STK39